MLTSFVCLLADCIMLEGLMATQTPSQCRSALTLIRQPDSRCGSQTTLSTVKKAEKHCTQFTPTVTRKLSEARGKACLFGLLKPNALSSTVRLVSFPLPSTLTQQNMGTCNTATAGQTARQPRHDVAVCQHAVTMSCRCLQHEQLFDNL